MRRAFARRWDRTLWQEPCRTARLIAAPLRTVADLAALIGDTRRADMARDDALDVAGRWIDCTLGKVMRGLADPVYLTRLPECCN